MFSLNTKQWESMEDMKEPRHQVKSQLFRPQYNLLLHRLLVLVFWVNSTWQEELPCQIQEQMLPVWRSTAHTRANGPQVLICQYCCQVIVLSAIVTASLSLVGPTWTLARMEKSPAWSSGLMLQRTLGRHLDIFIDLELDMDAQCKVLISSYGQ